MESYSTKRSVNEIRMSNARSFYNEFKSFIIESGYEVDRYELKIVDDMNNLTDITVVFWYDSLNVLNRLKSRFKGLIDMCDGFSAEYDKKYGAKFTFYFKNVYDMEG